MMDCGVMSAWCQECRQNDTPNGWNSLKTSWTWSWTSQHQDHFWQRLLQNDWGVQTSCQRPSKEGTLLSHSGGFFQLHSENGTNCEYILINTWNYLKDPVPVQHSEVRNAILWYQNLRVHEWSIMETYHRNNTIVWNKDNRDAVLHLKWERPVVIQ